jgi:hypothetical protein
VTFKRYFIPLILRYQEIHHVTSGLRRGFVLLLHINQPYAGYFRHPIFIDFHQRYMDALNA